MKKGILLLNIGTPQSPTVADVKTYLNRFLMDENVISIPYIWRWILVNLFILPIRSSRSAAKYQKIWTPNGSPLKVHMQSLTRKLQNHLDFLEPEKYIIDYGLAYSEPEIENSIQNIVDKKIDTLLVVPVFPQYAQATTGSMINLVSSIMKNKNITLPTQFLNYFYDQDFFIKNLLHNIQNQCLGKKIDHFIFSYHGLPISQLKQTTKCDLTENCSSKEKICKEKCYYRQCRETTRLLAKNLNLSEEQFTTTFQSRLGANKWLEPATEKTVQSFAGKNIAVVCPSFIVDCLETLEEINIEIRNTFKEFKGNDLTYISCLNDTDKWIKDFGSYLQKKA